MEIDGDTSGLGEWRNDNLGLTAAEGTAAGADADLDDGVRFIGAVLKAIRRRLSSPSAAYDPDETALFLLCPPDRFADATEGMALEPTMDTGHCVLAGRLWLASCVLRRGWHQTIQGDRSALFDLVREQLGLGGAAAALYEPSTPAVVRFFPGGLDQPEQCCDYHPTESEVTLDGIREAIDLVYKENLITPTSQPDKASVWKDSSKHQVASNAELLIQRDLKLGLKLSFPVCDIRMEQPGPPGRLDLEVEERLAGCDHTIVRHAILELKVLRSFNSTGKSESDKETAAKVQSGVVQAAAYRDDRHATHCALCCFDMRKSDTGEMCFADVSQQANGLLVALWRWFIYASAKAKQEADYQAS